MSKFICAKCGNDLVFEPTHERILIAPCVTCGDERFRRGFDDGFEANNTGDAFNRGYNVGYEKGKGKADVSDGYIETFYKEEEEDSDDRDE